MTGRLLVLLWHLWLMSGCAPTPPAVEKETVILYREVAVMLACPIANDPAIAPVH